MRLTENAILSDISLSLLEGRARRRDSLLFSLARSLAATGTPLTLFVRPSVRTPSLERMIVKTSPAQMEPAIVERASERGTQPAARLYVPTEMVANPLLNSLFMHFAATVVYYTGNFPCYLLLRCRHESIYGIHPGYGIMRSYINAIGYAIYTGMSRPFFSHYRVRTQALMQACSLLFGFVAHTRALRLSKSRKSLSREIKTARPAVLD